MTVGAVLRAVRIPRRSVFTLDDPDALRRWGERKLLSRPRTAGDLVVEVGDPRRLTATERRALLERLSVSNMALYASRAVEDDPGIVRGLARALGLATPYRGPLDGHDGVARIAVDSSCGSPGRPFITHTDRRMRWHTDGNASPEPVRSFLLHCVRDAARGGELSLVDPELAWLALADQGFEWVRALAAPDALTHPACAGADGSVRAAATGPVFSIDARSGDLHTRFTGRRRHVQWGLDAVTAEAAARLHALLDRDAALAVRVRLAPGMGVVCNNVLHTRSWFEEGPESARLMLRARFLERVPGTEGAWAALAG